MKVLIVVVTGLLGLSMGPAAFAWGDDCEYSRVVKREVNLNGSMLLNVEAGPGKLMIEGNDERKTALIDAKLCAETEAQLADMNVATEFNGDAVMFKTEHAKGMLWNKLSEGSYIDLSLYVPAGAKMDVVDTSGAAHVEGIASLDMIDSSGQLTIGDVNGDVIVKDSSGSLSIEGVGGSVWVTDSSGSIDVRDVIGDFTVEVDSSGSIEAKHVDGNVLVRVDSSGSIDVSDVGGDFTVGQDSSGGIDHQNVVGRVSLPN
jgi:hypothetical protein